MVNENKNKLYSAVAGAVVGAGVVIAGAIAMSDKKNQKKVNDVLTKTKTLVKDYSRDVQKRMNVAKNDVQDAKSEVNAKLVNGKETVKRAATNSLDKAIKVAKVAKKEVRTI